MILFTFNMNVEMLKCIKAKKKVENNAIPPRTRFPTLLRVIMLQYGIGMLF